MALQTGVAHGRGLGSRLCHLLAAVGIVLLRKRHDLILGLLLGFVANHLGMHEFERARMLLLVGIGIVGELALRLFPGTRVSHKRRVEAATAPSPSICFNLLVTFPEYRRDEAY